MENAPLSQSMLVTIVKPKFHCSRDPPIYTQDPLTQHQAHCSAIFHVPGSPKMDTSVVRNGCWGGTWMILPLKAHTMIFLSTLSLKSSKAIWVTTLCLCLIYEKFIGNTLNPTPFYFIFRCLPMAWYLLTLGWSSRALWSTLPAPDFLNT